MIKLLTIILLLLSTNAMALEISQEVYCLSPSPMPLSQILIETYKQNKESFVKKYPSKEVSKATVKRDLSQQAWYMNEKERAINIFCCF